MRNRRGSTRETSGRREKLGHQLEFESVEFSPVVRDSTRVLEKILGSNKSMKYIGTIVVTCLCAVTLLAQQSKPNVYWYRVWGRVVFKKTQPRSRGTVYVLGTRPINGRIPWTPVGTDGKFSIEFTDAPDDFSVCGHPTDSNGFLPLKPTPQEAAKMPNKLSCSKRFRLDGDHLERRVTLKFR
jgi:hypothetical protein